MRYERAVLSAARAGEEKGNMGGIGIGLTMFLVFCCYGVRCAAAAVRGFKFSKPRTYQCIARRRSVAVSGSGVTPLRGTACTCLIN